MEQNEIDFLTKEQERLKGIDLNTFPSGSFERAEVGNNLSSLSEKLKSVNVAAEAPPTQPPIEAKEEPKEEKVLTLSEILNTADGIEEPKEVVELPSDVKAKLDEADNIIKMFGEYSKTSEFKILNSGKKLQDLIERVHTQGISQNRTIESLIEDKINKNFGEKDRVDKFDIELNAFENLTPLQQKEYEERLRSEFKSTSPEDEMLKEWYDAFDEKAKQPTKEQIHKEQSEKRIGIIQADTKELDRLLNLAIEKRAAMHGVVIDKSVAEEIKKGYSPELADAAYLKEDVDKKPIFDANSFIVNRLWQIKGTDMLASQISEARADERKKVIAEYTADPNNFNRGGATNGNENISKTEEFNRTVQNIRIKTM